MENKEKTISGHVKLIRPEVLVTDTLVIEKDEKHNLRWREIFYWDAKLQILKTVQAFYTDSYSSPTGTLVSNIFIPVVVVAFDYIQKRQGSATYHIKQDVLTKEVAQKIIKHDYQRAIKSVVQPIVDHDGKILSFCVTELIF